MDDKVVKMLLVRDATTCKGRLGKLMEVTLMARLSRQSASGREAGSENE